MSEAKQKTVVVAGLGYVGLPVALLAATRGYEVYGYDVDESKVAQINSGVSPIEDEAIKAALAKKPITASTDPSIASRASVVIVAVPTPVTENKEPDLGPLKGVLETLLPHLQTGQLLSIESTINPGVMESVVEPILARREDLVLDVVHCPERINPGDTKWTVKTIPRVIGGLTPKATERGKKFYESILDAPVKAMASVTEAEAVKILENTFRDVNIAFVNEMAKSFDKLGIDVKHVIEGASTKPFAYMPHFPGNGVGGHCISVDPYYMIQRGRQAGFNHEFLQLARDINDSMPQYTVDRLLEGLAIRQIAPANAIVVVLGLAYKKNIDDTRESPAFTIVSLLEKLSLAQLHVFDPYVLESSTTRTLNEALDGAQVVVLATDHDEFTHTLTPAFLADKHVQVVVDGKNALDADGIAAKDIVYRGIGRLRDPK